MSLHTATVRLFLSTCVAILFCRPSIPAQWYGDGTALTESAVPMPPLSVLPGLHTDMPLDCVIGYMAEDTVRRPGTLGGHFYGPGNHTIGALRYSARFLYAIKDYNPILFRRYTNTLREREMYEQVFRSYSAGYSRFATNALMRECREFGIGYAVLSIADYVLHIQVGDVVVGNDPVRIRRSVFDGSEPEVITYLDNPDFTDPRINVAASVKEKIKGQYLPVHCVQDSEVYETTDGRHENGSATATCIKFMYPKNWMDDNALKEDGLRPVQAGEEYIVCLMYQPVNDSTDVIMPFGLDSIYGLFRVVDGRVEDPSNIWGLGTSPTLMDFRQRLVDMIRDIKEWSSPQRNGSMK